MTNLVLPNVNVQFVDGAGLPTRAAYTFFQQLESYIFDQIAQIKQTQDAVAQTQETVASYGSAINYIMTLLGDIQEDGGPMTYFGMDESGNRGWQPLLAPVRRVASLEVW